MISKNKKLNCAFIIINNFDIKFAFDKNARGNIWFKTIRYEKMYYQFIYKFPSKAIFLLHIDYEVCCIVAQKGRCIQINILFSRCLLKKLLNYLYT